MAKIGENVPDSDSRVVAAGDRRMLRLMPPPNPRTWRKTGASCGTPKLSDLQLDLGCQAVHILFLIPDVVRVFGRFIFVQRRPISSSPHHVAELGQSHLVLGAKLGSIHHLHEHLASLLFVQLQLLLIFVLCQGLRHLVKARTQLTHQLLFHPLFLAQFALRFGLLGLRFPQLAGGGGLVSKHALGQQSRHVPQLSGDQLALSVREERAL
mmetsp:Transcript_84603/g.213368  ORF Transcript_84603/g.213368 Transcript_84603/m.213368 type:complete len:210 (+) Transcript_84603:107-736(+)